MAGRKILNSLPNSILNSLGYDTNTDFDVYEFLQSKLSASRDELEGELSKHYAFVKHRTKKKKKDKTFTPPQIWRKTSKEKVLPRKGLKFSDVKRSHTMWLNYINECLQIKKLIQQGFTGDPTHSQWTPVSNKIAKADFHGAYLTVIRSITPGYVGIEGIVVLETKNVFQLLGKNDIVKTVQKKLCQFRFVVGEFEFTFFGKDILTKAGTRSVRKNKISMFNML